MGKWFKISVLALLLLAAAVFVAVPHWDSFQVDGELRVNGLQQPVTIKRDANGIPYIYADSFDDGLVAQGFVMAQARLAQMELFRAMANGELAAMIGEKGLKSDRLVHLINIAELAERQQKILTPAERNYVQRFVDGVNAYIEGYSSEHPKLLALMGHTPSPWRLRDVLALQYFQIWSSSANWKQELLAQSLIDALGTEAAAKLMPLNINPDRAVPASDSGMQAYNGLGDISALLAAFDVPMAKRLTFGSNGWVSGSRLNENGKPILTNDPHLDARHLPGFWLPMALITPELRVVGATAPGVPGFGVARTEHIAWGGTNGYGDMVDLYIETIDPGQPGHYLDGDSSRPFTQREVTIRVADRSVPEGFYTETLTIRDTVRGPVISDHGEAFSSSREAANANQNLGMPTNKVISLRWSVPAFVGQQQGGWLIGSESGNRDLLLATSLQEALQAVGKTPAPLNYVLADVSGNIARASTGFVPVRTRGNGLVPQLGALGDNWAGRIPPQEMPKEVNPERNWTGSANHDIVPDAYPYAYSTHFSPSWRYRRLQEMFDQPRLSADDHWAAVTDNKNMMAQHMVPVLLPVLQSDALFAPLAEALEGWDFVDHSDATAPLIFQTLFRNMAYITYNEALGESLSRRMLSEVYFWQERFVEQFMQDELRWFIPGKTPLSRQQLVTQAAQQTLQQLAEQFGNDPRRWQWGRAHTLTFFHPLVKSEFGSRWLGGGVHPASGSIETLNRAAYDFHNPEHSKSIPSIRIVMDLADSDKVRAHIPGGVSERLFDRSSKNQLPAWLADTPLNWWFSDAAISEHAVLEQRLSP